MYVHMFSRFKENVITFYLVALSHHIGNLHKCVFQNNMNPIYFQDVF